MNDIAKCRAIFSCKRGQRMVQSEQGLSGTEEVICENWIKRSRPMGALHRRRNEYEDHRRDGI